METIRKGYKQTDIGIIPEDWEVKRLGDIAEITKLAGFEYSKYFNSYQDGGEIIVVRGTNITNNYLDLNDVKYIPRRTSEFLKRSKLHINDLVFAYVGTIGPVFLITENDRYHLGPNTCRITLQEQVLPHYAFAYFKGALIINEINDHISIGAQPSLSMSKIRKFRIIAPSIYEQRAIAEVLSDIDSLIEVLDKKIAKKRAIKDGAMQQILTAKKRLPGFSDPWVEKKLGDILDYEQPTNYIIQCNDYLNSGIPVLTAGKTFILGYTHETTGIYDNLPVIIFDDFTTASKYVDFPFKVKSSAMKILTINNIDYNLRFIFELMQIIYFPLSDHQRYWISEYSELIIKLPNNLKEQQAIAEILTDMDAEIELLEQQRSKYTALKQGTMQQLLTGQIRLVTR